MKMSTKTKRAVKAGFSRIVKSDSVKAKLKKEALNLIQNEQSRATIAMEPMMGLAVIAAKLAMAHKRIEGANGINLQPSDQRTVELDSESTTGFTQSASMYMYRTPRKRVPDAVKYVMKRTVSANVSSDADLQNMMDINIFDAVPVDNNPGDATDYTPLSVKKAFETYLLGETRAANSSSLVLAKNEQQSLHFKSLSVDLTIANLGSQGAIVDLYELVPQHNLGATSYNMGLGSRMADGFMSPYWCFEQGLSTTNVTQNNGGTAMTPFRLGSRPQDSTRFNRTWKMVKRIRLNLSTGAVHRHKSFYEINKTVSYVEWGQISAQGGKFAGWNPTFLLVTRGVPTSTDAATGSSIKTTCNIQVNYEGTPDRQSKAIVYDANL